MVTVPGFEAWAARRHPESDAGGEGDDDGGRERDPRSPFERDRNRIIHSGAFRRLQGKTQVFGVGDADFYRTRLTHSLECAQIGRALAMRVSSDHRLWELCEAACLAHDLGHPPFGHNGEDELDELLRPHGLGFEGNAQTLRVVARLEVRSDEHGGLNLTRGTLASLVKYPQPRSSGARKYVYDDDAALVAWALEGTPAAAIGQVAQAGQAGQPALRPLTLDLMDLADDVAYSTHDVEDGVRARFITPLELRDQRVAETVTELGARALKAHGLGLDVADVRAVFGELLSRLDPDTAYQSGAARKRVGRYLISNMVGEVSFAPVPEGGGDPLWGTRLVVPDHVRKRCEVLKQLSRACVMQDSRVTTIRHKGREIVRRLFGALCENALAEPPAVRARFDLFPLHRRAMLAASPDAQTKVRHVADYVAGMTDSFAMRMFARLFLPQQGTLFDVL